MSEEINNELQSHKTDRKLTLRDTDFMSMMQRRIFNVLIVANPYDAFMLEDDGRIDEKVFEEYSKLGLRFPPRFFRAASHDDAVSLLGEHVFRNGICFLELGPLILIIIVRMINEFPIVVRNAKGDTFSS